MVTLLLSLFLQQPMVKVIIGYRNPATLQNTVRGVGGSVTRTFRSVTLAVSSVPASQIPRLRRNPNIRFVEIDSEVHALSLDPSSAWGIERIGSPIVNQIVTGVGVKVGVIDTGADYTHPELAFQYRGGTDCWNHDDNPFDDNGHGTHVSGTLVGTNVGVAPGASLYAIKVLNAQGGANWSDVICGVQWAIDNGMQVTNNSYGGLEYSQGAEEIFQAAENAGIISVAAAGNEGCCDTVIYPAKFTTTIAVSATGRYDQLMDFSSTGPEVDLAAPGHIILSAYKGGGYLQLSGTSMAAPHVAGTVALLLSAGHPISNMFSTARDLGFPGRDDGFGYGLVSSNLAFGIPDPPPPSPIKVSAISYGPQSVTISVTRDGVPQPFVFVSATVFSVLKGIQLDVGGLTNQQGAATIQLVGLPPSCGYKTFLRELYSFDPLNHGDRIPWEGGVPQNSGCLQ